MCYLDTPRHTHTHQERALVDHTAELTHISLCAGYGGIDLGLKRALRSVRTVAFSEIEAYAVANLVAKIENGHLDAAPIWTNLKTFPWGAFRGRVDILSGGFPCQPFSQAGRRAGDDDPRHLWPYIERGIRELGRPPLIFLENVEGILSASLSGTGWSDPAGTPVLQHILRELERMDYRATAGVFSAAEVGAPHQRKRVFILAVRSDLSADGHGRVSRLLEDSNSSRERQGEQGRPNGQERRAVDGGGEALFQRTARADHARSTGVRGRATMEYAESRGRKCAGGRGQSTEQGVPVQVREPSTGADLAHTHNAGDAALRDNANRNGEARGCGRGCDEPQLEPMRRGEACGICGDDRRPLNAGEDRGDLWPAGRGARQYAWEPPRVTPREQEYIKPAMGGGVNGCAGGVGYGDLRRAVDSRTDELRLLGNGVVPATAERAFRVLWGELDTRAPRMIDYPRTTTTGGAMYYDDEDSDDRDETLDPAPDFGEWCDERLRATPRALWPLSSIIDAYEAETGAPAPLPAEALDELSARFEIDPRGGSEPLIAAARRA